MCVCEACGANVCMCLFVSACLVLTFALSKAERMLIAAWVKDSFLFMKPVE